jgi:hypothetical protein
LVGQYQLGDATPDNFVVKLTLSRYGKFMMITNLGHKVKLQGDWRLDGTQVILRLRHDGYFSMEKYHVFGWRLRALWREGSFDLVPIETLEAYQKDPANVMTRYRRVDAAPRDT